MSDTTAPRAGAAHRETAARLVNPTIALIAAIQLGTALWIVAAPHSFFDQIGPFGTYNGHFLRDAAAFEAGLGLALAAALRWPALRAGALAATLASTALHALDHWIDVGKAHPGSHAGIVDAVSLTLLTAVVAAALYLVVREPGA